jgi:endonuclease/exonuclease/phosphatase family metal-dependent hydrolase
VSSAANSSEGLQLVVNERGHLSRSIAGVTSDTTAGGTLTLNKPAGAIVRSAYMGIATTGFTATPLSDPVTVDGQPVSLDNLTLSGISSYNYFTDVTGLVKPKLDAAAAGWVSFNVAEPQPPLTDGEVVVVIYDDPSVTVDQTVSILFGALSPTGDQYSVHLASPISLADPATRLEMSLGISFSYQLGGVQQYSTVDVNNTRISSSAGGEDDGQSHDGELLTVGGDGDSTDNPPDPQALPTNPRSDDELYDLRPFVRNGSSEIDVKTTNPSLDDNVFMATFTMNPPVTTIDTGFQGQSTFKAMTYNVQGDLINRSKPGDPSSYADAIAANGADVVGLQEISHGEASRVARELGWGDGCYAGSTYCYWRADNALTGEGIAILSRYPLTNQASWQLSPQGKDADAGRCTVFNSKCDHERYLIRATATINGERVNFYNTHLTVKSGQIAAQATQVRDQISKDAAAAATPFKSILVGDMNATTWRNGAAISTLSEHRIDAWAALHPEATQEMCHFTKEPPPPAGPPAQATPLACGDTSSSRTDDGSANRQPFERIDFILIGEGSDLKPVNATVPGLFDLIPKRNGSTATMPYWHNSDHLPVISTIATDPLNPSARVYYTGEQQHVYELLLKQGYGWAWSDLTIVAHAPVAASAASTFISSGATHVVYRTFDGRIEELSGDGAGGWTAQDLYTAAGIPASAPRASRAVGDPSGYTSPGPRIAYRTADNHVRELSFDGNAWTQTDLSQVSGVAGVSGASASADPSGYSSPAPRVVFRGTDNRVHEFYFDGSRWIHADLSALSGRPAEVRSKVVGYLSPSGARVLYRGSDSHVHELFQRPADGVWVHADLQVLAKASAASGDVSGFASPLATVEYHDSSGRVRQLVQETSGTWHFDDLQALAADSGRSVGTSVGYTTPFFADVERVIYRDTRNRVRELRRDAYGIWHVSDLSQLAGAPAAYNDPAPIAVSG